MKLLVTGREGQLARSLAELARHYPAFELHFAARPACDLAIPGSAAAAIDSIRPDLVVNAAAYTGVDRAEQEEALAFRVNADAVAEIADAAAREGMPLVHVSTDYVFAGTGEQPIAEDAPIAPLGTYGRTKAEGEARVRAAQPDHLILRTAWVYSPFGVNFVKTMLRLAGQREEIGVVADQIGSPTSALDLARLILDLAERRRSGDRSGWSQTYHAVGAGQASWAEVAEAVMADSVAVGGPSARIKPIATADYPTPAQRPRWSVLDGERLEQSFGLRLPEWRLSLRPIVARLVGTAA